MASPQTTIKTITADALKSLQLPTPPTLGEQQEIVTILDAIDRKIELHRKKRAVLDELFKALLHKLMTGDIRITDLDLSALDDPSPVMPGLVPGIHVDGGVKPDHDDQNRAAPSAEAAQ